MLRLSHIHQTLVPGVRVGADAMPSLSLNGYSVLVWQKALHNMYAPNVAGPV